MKTWTLDELRALDPKASEAELAAALAEINRPAASLEEAWRSENTTGSRPPAIGADGLTKPQRDLNRWADENVLPTPFPRRAR